MTKTKIDTKKIAIIILIIFSLFIFASVGISYALMGDKLESGGIIQFKQHKLDIEIVGGDSIVLTPEEVIQGETAKRVLNIKNPQNSTSCVLRIWLEFYVGGVIDENYMIFSINNSNFTRTVSGSFYYNQVLASGAEINGLELNFSVGMGLDKKYQGKNYEMKLYVESIQATTEAVEEWKDDYSPEWKEKIKTKLT